MRAYRVTLTSDSGSTYEWTYQADDAAHAIEQHIECGHIDGTDIVVTYIEVKEVK